MTACIRAQRVLLESAARTATTVTQLQQDAVMHSVRLYLNVTAASGTGGLTLSIRGRDKASSAAPAIAKDAAAITATGLYVFELAPNAAAADTQRHFALSALLPVLWDVQIAHGDASQYTYSLSGELTS